MGNRAYKVVNIRSGGQYSLMACDVAIGYTNEAGEFEGEFQVNGIFLKSKKDGSGYYYDAPFKYREKNGERVKDDKGYDKKDYHFDLFMEKGVGPTKAAHAARKSLITALVEAWQATAGESTSTGRGTGNRPAPVAQRTARPASAKTTVDTPAVGSPTDTAEGDDPFPFF